MGFLIVYALSGEEELFEVEMLKFWVFKYTTLLSVCMKTASGFSRLKTHSASNMERTH